MDSDRILSLICSLPALVVGLTVHEFAHAWAADKLGDPTPRREGRLTLDPLVHIDPFGALFFIISSLAGFGLGWAKPVMTDPRNLKHPHRDGLLIAIAGPISNVLQTPVWLLLLVIFGFVSAKMNITPGAGISFPDLLTDVLLRGVLVNLTLAAFNMIPIPPLDGHWVLGALAGEPLRRLYDAVRPYSFIILIVLINTPIFTSILSPVQQFALNIAFRAFGAGYAWG